MDRNNGDNGKIKQSNEVALRKESVDRNINQKEDARKTVSLSARRAWIEISLTPEAANLKAVALRKESVDRNVDTQNFCICIIQSLSARRAWIEIL